MTHHDEGREARLRAAIDIAEKHGNVMMAQNIRKALEELKSAYRSHPPYTDREL